MRPCSSISASILALISLFVAPTLVAPVAHAQTTPDTADQAPQADPDEGSAQRRYPNHAASPRPTATPVRESTRNSFFRRTAVRANRSFAMSFGSMTHHHEHPPGAVKKRHGRQPCAGLDRFSEAQ